MILHVTRRELAARWILLPAAIVVGALAMITIHSIGHVRGDADGIMNGTWVGTLVVSTIVGMSLLGEELTNSRLSFYFARPFSPSTIFGGKIIAGVALALLMQIAIVLLVAIALPELSWRGSALAQRDALSVAGERVLATIGCTLLGMTASIALGSKSRWFVVDALGAAFVGVIGTWFALRLEPDPSWLPAEAIRSVGEKALLHAIAFAIAVAGLGVATARALAVGRTDRMRAHRTLSTTLWPIVVPASALLLVIGEQTQPNIPEPPVVANGVLVAPEVEIATVLASEDMPVPYLLVADETGAVRVGAAASWAKLDANRVRLARTASMHWVRRFLRQQYAYGTLGDPAVVSIWKFEDDLEHYASLQRGLDSNHPAPPNASAGISPTKAVKPLPDYWWLVHQQAITNARAAGILGLVVDRRGSGFPRRVKTVPERFCEDRKMSAPMVLAPPTLKAKSLIDIIAITRGAIAVSHANKVRPLRLGSCRYYADYSQEDWIEVRVSRSKVVVEAVPDKPIEVADIEDLAAALHEVREARGIDAGAPIDVLVDPDVETQQLVDVLVALDLAGVRTVGIGTMPGAEDLALRGHRIPNTSVGYPYVRDRDGTRRYAAKMNVEEINRCYTDALADDPNLSGTVMVRFFVEADGEVTAVTASGIAPELADCVAGVFETLAFPRSKRGVGAQAEVGVSFRP